MSQSSISSIGVQITGGSNSETSSSNSLRRLSHHSALTAWLAAASKSRDGRAVRTDYYQQHAGIFFADTVGVDMASLYRRFLPLLPDRAEILDAGCGSGRDARAFADLGHRVTAFDASPALVALAESHLGRPVHCLRLQDIAWREAFDGVWACASLLHVPAAKLPDVVGRLCDALRPGGVLYASFKYGRGAREHRGRRFTDLDEPGLAELLKQVPGLAPVETWTTGDLRPGREAERWLNTLLRRAQGA